MKGLRLLMLLVLQLLLLPAVNASASDSEEERLAAAKRYLEVAQMSKMVDDTATELAKALPVEPTNLNGAHENRNS